MSSSDSTDWASAMVVAIRGVGAAPATGSLDHSPLDWRAKIPWLPIATIGAWPELLEPMARSYGMVSGRASFRSRTLWMYRVAKLSRASGNVQSALQD